MASELETDARYPGARRDQTADFEVSTSTALIDFPADRPKRLGEAFDEEELGRQESAPVEELPIVVGRLDDAGRLVMLTGGGLARLGLDRDALLGADFADLFPAGAEAVECARRGARASFEVFAGGGERAVRRLRVDVFPDRVDGAAIGLIAQEAPSAGSAKNEVLHAVDAERQRIGADLHDEVGQLLTGITCLSTALIERLRGRDDLAAEDAAAIAQTAREALAQVRSLAHGLAPVRLTDRGLACALEEFAQLVRRMHDVDLQLSLPRQIPDLDGESIMHLFRIVQEAVANAVRHGRATRIDVVLQRFGHQHRLTVADNGAGFSPGSAPDGSGSGLRLMEYRAALLQGGFSVTSSPARGTRIEISFTSTPSRNHEAAC